MPAGRNRVVLGALAVAIAVIALGAFVAVRRGGSGLSTPATTPLAPESATTTTTVAHRPGEPFVDTVVAPPRLSCSVATSVEVSWTTSDASDVAISVDGTVPIAYYPPSGRASLPFACDGASHTYTVTASSPRGRGASRSVTVLQV